MKNANQSFLALVATLALASCSSESVPGSLATVRDFLCKSETMTTKTSLSNVSIVWSESDQIGVFASAGPASLFTVKGLSDDGLTATFTGEVADADSYYAVYPYNSSFALTSGGAISAAIPAEQAFTESSFSSGANLAVAFTAGESLSFKNVGAILRFTVTAPDIKTVTLTSDAVVAGGTATIDYNGGAPTVSVSGGENSVSMSGDFESGKTYIFVVYPGKYNTISLTFTTSEGKSSTYTNSTAIDIARNANINLGDLDLTLSPAISVAGTSTYAGSTLKFSTDDLGADTEYEWTFEGGTPSASTGREVEVTYSNAGKYDVSLSVKSGARSGSTTKEEFVSVYPGTPLLFLPFDGDYEDHGPNGIAVDRIDSESADEVLNWQAGHTGIASSSAYFPGFSNSKYSVLSITDETFGSMFNSTGSWTVSFWLRLRYGKGGASYFFSQGTGNIATGWHYMRLDNQISGSGGKYRLFYQLRYTDSVNDDNSINYKYNYDGVNTPSSLDIDLRDQAWHHIVVRSVVEGSGESQTMSWKLYVDGQPSPNGLVNNGKTVKTLGSYLPFVIGASYLQSTGEYANTMQGNLDDFIIWNRGLSVADMRSLCNY